MDLDDDLGILGIGAIKFWTRKHGESAGLLTAQHPFHYHADESHSFVHSIL